MPPNMQTAVEVRYTPRSLPALVHAAHIARMPEAASRLDTAREDPFRVVPEPGQAGRAEAFAAPHSRRDRRVAVKALEPEFALRGTSRHDAGPADAMAG